MFHSSTMRIISLLFICLCLCRGALGDTTNTTCPRSQTDPFFHLRSEVACPLIHGRELHSDAKDNIVSFEDWKKIREDVVEATESDTTVDTTEAASSQCHKSTPASRERRDQTSSQSLQLCLSRLLGTHPFRISPDATCLVALA